MNASLTLVMLILVIASLQTPAAAQSRQLHPYIHLDRYCDGDASATVTVSGDRPGFRFRWLHDGSTNATVEIPRALFGTRVCVERTCPCGKVDTICFVFNPSVFPTIQLNGQAIDATCSDVSDGRVEVGANRSGLSFRWSDGSSGQRLGGLGAGVYTVTATDVLGCTASASFSVRAPEPVQGVQIFTTPTRCPGSADGEARIAGLGAGANVVWLAGVGAVAHATGLPAGTHHVRISDNGRCSTFPFTVGAPEGPTITTEQTKAVTCHGDRDAAVQITVAGSGLGPFTVNFNGQSKRLMEHEPLMVDNLPAGVYTVQVTDVKGCTSTKSRTIGQPAPLRASLDIPDHNGFAIGCHGETAQVEFHASGGNGGYDTRWKKGSEVIVDGPSTAELRPGRYTVEVADSKGCVFLETFELSEPEKIRIDERHVRKNRLFTIVRFKAKGGTGALRLSKRWAITFGKKRVTVVATDDNDCEKSRAFVIKTKAARGKKWDSDPSVNSNAALDCWRAFRSWLAAPVVRRNPRFSGVR